MKINQIAHGQVTPLTHQELVDLNGGNIIKEGAKFLFKNSPWGIVIGFAANVLDNWDDSAAAFQKGYEYGYNYGK